MFRLGFQHRRSDMLTIRRPSLVLFGLLCGPWLSGIASPPASRDDKPALPRYRLEVGQELLYRGEDKFEYTGGSFRSRTSWQIWVVRKNPDQSWRLLLRHGSADVQERQGKAGDLSAQPEDVTFAWCDLFSDGRLVENDSFGFRMSPLQLLVRLPADAKQAEGEWSVPDGRLDETYRYKTLPAAEVGSSAFEVVRDSAMNAIYGLEFKNVVTFDEARGVPQKVASTTRQTYGFEGKGEGTVALVEIKTNPAEWCRQFADEAERHFAARSAFEKQANRKDLPAEELKSALTAAVADLKSMADRVETSELKKLIAADAAAREQEIEYRVSSVSERAAVIGTPAVEWSTTDTTGKNHALADYRGKVIVLDFWYRGCGWCIRAMPQMKQIAAHFESKPVVVFGMNTDRKDEDAQFVIDKMGLNYPTLKAEKLPEKYQVRGFPTLLILDQEGVVRDVHVGYSPTLREEVTASVERLLDQKR